MIFSNFFDILVHLLFYNLSIHYLISLYQPLNNYNILGIKKIYFCISKSYNDVIRVQITIVINVIEINIDNKV